MSQIIFSLLVGIFVVVIYRAYIFLINHKQVIDRQNKLNAKLKEIVATSRSQPLIPVELKLFKKENKTENYLRAKLVPVNSVSLWLQRAGLHMNPILFFLEVLAFGGVCFFFCYKYFPDYILINAAIACASTLSFPLVFLSFLISRRKKLFLKSFPTALDIIKRALRAGYTPNRAIENVSEQMQDIVGQTFKLIIQKIKLGESLEAALIDTSNKTSIDEFRLLSIVIILQQETGGNLAETIDNFSRVIRSRIVLRKKINAITSEGKTGAIVVGSLPLALMGVVSIANPKYLNPLFNTPQGHQLLLIGGALLITGLVTIGRMVYKDYY